MFKRPLLILAMVVLAVVLTYLDVLAFKHFLYWRLWWFDIVMHALGGLLLGLFGLWWYAWSSKTDLKSITISRTVGVSLVVVLTFGIVWEFVEFGVDRIYLAHMGLKTLRALQQGWLDGLGDLLSDLAGGLLAGLVIAKTSRWKQNSN